MARLLIKSLIHVIPVNGLLLVWMLAIASSAMANVDAVDSVGEGRISAPNIIVILADDLGYGDIGAFGAKDIITPRIDQLGERGIKLTEFYSASAVCSPSRAGLMTGRHPARIGISHVFMYDAPEGMPLSEITVAEQLKKTGYQTGMVGKWHLGHQDRYMPWNQGFDEFYGVPFSNDMPNFFFYENKEMILEPIDQRYLTRRYTEKALDFIERNSAAPFFLYLAHSMPHVPLYVSPEFEGSSSRGLYGDVVQELDWSVGEIVDKLRDLNLLDNTLVVFSSDNGPWLAMGSHGGSSGGLRDGKGSTFEGGQRVPTVIHWPSQIAAGRVDNTITSLLDLMPTFSSLAAVPLPDDRVIDGKDITPILLGNGFPSRGKFFYSSVFSTDIVAYRDGPWKIKLPQSGYPKFLEPILRLNLFAHGLLLFNLDEDPFETNNLAGSHPERVRAMKGVIQDFEKDVALGKPRNLLIRSINSDKAGYGPLYAKIGVLAIVGLLIIGGVVYFVCKIIKAIFCNRKH